jgi:hypothetical protein
MPFTVHIVNTPQDDVRNKYLDAWREIDARNLRHPSGRRFHLAWTIDDVLHVVDVWDSPDQQEAFMRDLKPILDQFEMTIDEAPEVGELVQVVQPPA